MLLRWMSLALAATLALLTAPGRAAEGGVPHRALRLAPDTGRVIVKFRTGATALQASTGTQARATVAALASGPQAAGVMGRRLGLSLGDGRVMGPRSQVMTASGLSSAALARRLAADREVEWAVVDGRRFVATAPNDPLYADNLSSSVSSLTAGQWYLRAPTSSVRAAINAEGAWSTTRGSSQVVVAVLDTGVRTDHPDLSDKLLPGYDFVSYADVANDGGGRDSDPSDPGDWVTAAENAAGNFKDCGETSSSWHGTQVSGIIAASTDNGIGMAGTAPNVKILPVRVLGKCGGYDSDIIDGMRWAAGLSVSGVPANPYPAQVLNMSLGSSGTCSTAYAEAVAEVNAAGAVVVAAAGNDSLAVGAPANCSGVIAVGGLRHTGTKGGYSNLGPEVAISAPMGNCVNDTTLGLPCLYSILSTTNSGTTSPVSATYSDADNYAIGTSFSSPMVAGVAALMVSAHPSLTPAQVRSLLQSSARSFPDASTVPSVAACTAPGSTEQGECRCTTSTCGAGMLDAAAAVSAFDASSVPIPAIQVASATVTSGSSLTLSGSGSSARSGRTISAYAWTLVSGASLASFSGSTTGASATLVAHSAGTVVVRLTVTDSAGESASQDQALLITPGAPEARITASTTRPEVGQTVTLDGSASAAQGDASLTNYEWEISVGSDLAQFSGATTAATAQLLLTGAGTVTVRLTVTDSNGFSASTTQTLAVSEPASSGGGGGGGGALAPVWGLALLGLGVALRRPRRDRR